MLIVKRKICWFRFHEFCSLLYFFPSTYSSDFVETMKSSLFLDETISSTLSSINIKDPQSVRRIREHPLEFENQTRKKVKPSSITSTSNKKQRPVNIPSPKDLSTCKCSKTNCLKLYCECFRRGSLCSSLCECKDCANTKDNHKQVQETIRKYLNKDLMSFSKKPKPQTCSCRSNRWVEVMQRDKM